MVCTQHIALYLKVKLSFELVTLCFADAENGAEKPHFDSRSRIFELDPCAGNGKVCLVYKNCSEGDQ